MNLIKNIIFVTGKINAVLIIITQMVLAQVSIALSHFIYIYSIIYMSFQLVMHSVKFLYTINEEFNLKVNPEWTQIKKTKQK